MSGRHCPPVIISVDSTVHCIGDVYQNQVCSYLVHKNRCFDLWDTEYLYLVLNVVWGSELHCQADKLCIFIVTMKSWMHNGCKVLWIRLSKIHNKNLPKINYAKDGEHIVTSYRTVSQCLQILSKMLQLN